MLDMDTNMDAMSNTLLHMRNQLTNSQREINLLKEENIRLKTLYESNGTININESTSNGTNHTDRSDVSTKNKRSHLLNRTTPNIDVTNKLKAINDFYDIDATTPSLMDVESISLNSTNNDDNQHSPLENGI